MGRPGIITLLSTIIISCSLFISLAGCALKSAPLKDSQLVTIKWGNLAFDITGAGNLALSQTKDLPFEIAGYVESVLVQEGEAVKEGQELARYKYLGLGKKVLALDKAIITARRNLAAKESALTQVSRQVTDKEYSLRQSQIDLTTAHNGLNDITQIKEIQDRIDTDKDYLNLAQSMYQVSIKSPAGGDTAFWKQEITNTQKTIDTENKELQDLLNGSSVKLSASDLEEVTLKVTTYNLNLDKTQKRWRDARRPR